MRSNHRSWLGRMRPDRGGDAEIAGLFANPVTAARALDERLPQPRDERPWPLDFSVAFIPGERAAEAIVEPGQSFMARIPVANPGTQAAWRGKATLDLRDIHDTVRIFRVSSTCCDSARGPPYRSSGWL